VSLLKWILLRYKLAHFLTDLNGKAVIQELLLDLKYLCNTRSTPSAGSRVSSGLRLHIFRLSVVK